MGRIVGGVGSSHAPSFGPVFDKGQQKDPMWAPLFDGYVPVRAWLESLRPDLFIVVYNDHVNQFFFDAYPTFALWARRKSIRRPTKAGASAICRTCRAIRRSRGTSRAVWWTTSSIRRSARRCRWITACCRSCRC